ncbi:hypothetical protein LCGC14_2070220 [marine sediment metagenome]|uniref:Uncharacterized protein n=1 Tax=marine sediment metagenome TaxID=412755 RepID=A0A0F9EIJ3_9ZZZZ
MAKDTPSDERISVWSALMDRFRDLMHFRSNADELSDVDTRAAIQAALETTTDNFVFIVAVFDDHVIFERGFSGTLTSRGFSISEDGTVTLATEEVQVRPVTEFVPVNVTQEEDMTANTEKVSGLIGSDRTRFTEDHRSWLEGLSDDELSTLEPQEITSETPSGEPEKNADETTSQRQTSTGDEATPASTAEESENHEPVTPETFLKSAPSDIQEILQEGLALQASRKKGLVSILVANSRCEFTQQELETQKVSELEKLAKLANIPDYSGKATPRINEADDDGPPKAPDVFPLKAVS